MTESEPQSTVDHVAGDAGPPPVAEPEPPPAIPNDAPVEPPAASGRAEQIYRHALPVRLAHWVNVLCLVILVMSGFQIFNAHPALYWGERSDRDKPFMSMRAVRTDDGRLTGVTTVAGHAFDTTGVFGVSDGRRRGFPSWLTLPSGQWLALGRRWHFFFAWLFVINGVAFAAYAVASRHASRQLIPKGRDLRGIGRAIADHVRWRHPRGEEARHYNVLQKLAYTGVIFGLAPLIVLTGLTMSPDLDAAMPQLLSVFGGRQSARTIHFFACLGFIGFVAVHVFMVLTTGLLNNLRSMVTGWFLVREEGSDAQQGPLH
jgi:thiosulfate reductase cytochrome b subunit